jgi:predicted nuclease with TOPRIM domain
VESEGDMPMSSDYLKKDKERVENKFKELKSKGEIEAMEKRLKSLEDEDSTVNRIWAEIYRDVLDLKKKEEEYGNRD